MVTDLRAVPACLKLGDGRTVWVHRGMLRSAAALVRAAGSQLSVLIQGETGCGKDVVARGIHDMSDRASGPLVVVNCAAIPDTLLESELFGHKKGSFTGAVSDKVGKFEAANGGSIFLDEIGEMPIQLQQSWAQLHKMVPRRSRRCALVQLRASGKARSHH